MYYEENDFLETANSSILQQIARARELTREYYFSDYADTEKRSAIHPDRRRQHSSARRYRR